MDEPGEDESKVVAGERALWFANHQFGRRGERKTP
jgi:hypothetical protein